MDLGTAADFGPEATFARPALPLVELEGFAFWCSRRLSSEVVFPLLDELQSLTKSLKLENTVHFHVGVPWDKLAEKLKIMDVGIVVNRVNVATELMLPSRLIDYTVLGIPAIVPRLKAIEYYFSDETVSYFEPENVNSMVAATVSLYRDSARRERQARSARKFLDENPWDGHSSGLHRLYDHLFNLIDKEFGIETSGIVWFTKHKKQKFPAVDLISSLGYCHWAIRNSGIRI